MGTRIQVMPSAAPDARIQKGVSDSTSTLTLNVGPKRVWFKTKDTTSLTLSQGLLKVC